MKPERVLDPGNQPDRHLEKRHGVPSRRDLVQAQRGGERRGNAAPGIAVGDGSVILTTGVRKFHVSGAGVTVSVQGDTVTLEIAGGSGGTITVQEGDATVDGAAGVLDFDASDFNITSSPSGEANIALNYGTGAGQPAEGNHTHAQLHDAATVSDSSSIDLTLSGQQISAAAIFGSTAGTVAEGDHAHDPDHLDYTFKAVNKNPGAATVTTVGMAAPTLTATASNTDDAEGPWLNHATGAVSGNASGVVSAFTQLRRDWEPSISFTVKTPASAANVRWWIGVWSNTVDASATPSVHMAAFRYDTAADGTAFWRCVTNNGGAASHSVQATSVAVATATRYRFEIRLKASTVEFYIDGTLVHTSSTALPTATQLMGYGVRVTTLAASAQNIKWGRIAIQQPY